MTTLWPTEILARAHEARCPVHDEAVVVEPDVLGVYTCPGDEGAPTHRVEPWLIGLPGDAHPYPGEPDPFEPFQALEDRPLTIDIAPRRGELFGRMLTLQIPAVTKTPPPAWKVVHPLATRFMALPAHGGSWAHREGRPSGAFLHYTVGCQQPGGTLFLRGLSVQLAVTRPGEFGVPGPSLIQYTDLDVVAFHAYDASNYYVGIETAAYPGVCEIVASQIDLLELAVAWLGMHYEFPMQRVPGGALGPLGIKVHADGLAPGVTWNPMRHYDSPVDAAGDPINAWVTSAQAVLLNRSPSSAASFVAGAKGSGAGGDDPLMGLSETALANLTKMAAEWDDLDDFISGADLGKNAAYVRGQRAFDDGQIAPSIAGKAPTSSADGEIWWRWLGWKARQQATADVPSKDFVAPA